MSKVSSWILEEEAVAEIWTGTLGLVSSVGIVKEFSELMREEEAGMEVISTRLIDLTPSSKETDQQVSILPFGIDFNSLDVEPYKILATADDFSKLRLYRYPCIQVNSGCVEAIGHSSHVTNVKWSKMDSYVYSTGGEDQCVLQWKVVRKYK